MQTRKDFVIDISYFKDDGNPKTEDVIGFFRLEGLNIVGREYDDMKRFQYRGLTRNDAVLSQTEGGYVIWGDCDHVFSKDYIERLIPELEKIGPTSKCISAGRMTMTIEDGDRLVSETSEKSHTWFHEDVWERASSVNLIVKHKIGIGHTQIAHVPSLKNGIYVPEGGCWDGPWRTKSDIQFRKICGGLIALPEFFMVHQLHINHSREHGIQR